MRNTFFSLCSEYHLLSKAFERDAVKETQQIKAFSLALSRSSPYAGNDRSGWWVDGGENDAGKKVRMTCEDMLWLLPWLDSAGLIMDGLLCWQGLNTKSQRRLRPGCLLAMCIRSLLCFITAGGCIGLVEFHLEFETSSLTWDVNNSFSRCFMADPFYSRVISKTHPQRTMEMMLRPNQPDWTEKPESERETQQFQSFSYKSPHVFNGIVWYFRKYIY